MVELGGQVGELRFTIHITRKETGQVETYQLIGVIDPDKMKELQDVSNSQHSGA